MPNGQIEQYYDYLKKNGADVPPTLQSFQNTLSDENSAKQYYGYLKKNNFDAPDTYDSFANTLGLKKKDVSQPSSVGGGQSGQLPSSSTSQSNSGNNFDFEKAFPKAVDNKPTSENTVVAPSPVIQREKLIAALPSIKAKQVNNIAIHNLMQKGLGANAIDGNPIFTQEKANVAANIKDSDWLPSGLQNQPTQAQIQKQAIDDFSAANNETPESVAQNIQNGKYVVDAGKVKEVGGFGDNFAQVVRDFVNNLGLAIKVGAAQSRNNPNEVKYVLNQYANDKKNERETTSTDPLGYAGKIVGGVLPYAASTLINPYMDIPLMGLNGMGENHAAIATDPTLTDDQKVKAVNETGTDAFMINGMQGAMFHGMHGFGDEGKTAAQLLDNYAPTAALKKSFTQSLYDNFSNLAKTAPSDVAKAAAIGGGTAVLNDLNKNKAGIKVDFSDVPESALQMAAFDLIMKAPQVLSSAYNTLAEAKKNGYDKTNPDWYNSYSKDTQDALNTLVKAPEPIYQQAISSLDKSPDNNAANAKEKIQTFRDYYTNLPDDMSDAAKDKALHILQLKTEAVAKGEASGDSGIKKIWNEKAKAYDGLLQKLYEDGNVDEKKEPLLIPRFATSISSPQNSEDGKSNEADAETQANEGQQGVLGNQAQTGNEGAAENAAPVLKSSDEQPQPIRQLNATGGNVYYETPKIRVNDGSNGKTLLIVHDNRPNDGWNSTPIEFDSPKEAVQVAEILHKEFPNGITYGLDEKGIVDRIKKEGDYFESDRDALDKQLGLGKYKKAQEPQPQLSTKLASSEESNGLKQSQLNAIDARNLYDRHNEITSETPPESAHQIALDYLATGGKVHPESINDVVGTTERASLNTDRRKVKSGEVKARDYAATPKDIAKAKADKSGNKPLSVDYIAHKLWDNLTEEHQNAVSTQDIKEALQDAISKHNSRFAAAKDYSDTYDYKKILDRHYEELGKQYEEEAKKQEKELNDYLISEGEKDFNLRNSDGYINHLIDTYESEYGKQDKQPSSASEGEGNKEIGDNESGARQRDSTTSEPEHKQIPSPSETTEGETTTRSTTEGKTAEDAQGENGQSGRNTSSIRHDDAGTTTNDATSTNGTGDGQQRGQSGRESVEKAGDIARKAAEIIRSGKISKLGGFHTSTGFDLLWDASLETVAKTLEAGASIADAIEAGLKQFRESDWYKNLSDKKNFEQKYTDHLNNEFKDKVGNGIPPSEEDGSEEEGGGENTVGVNHASLNDLAERLGFPPIERGTILTPEQYADRGRALLNAGADPYSLDEYKGEIEDKISIARAHEEMLAKKADAIKDKNSQEYKDAAKELYNYSKDVVKPLGTKFAAIGTSLQGDRNIDTDSFTSVSRQVQDNSGTDLTPKQTADIEKLTNAIKDLKTRLEQAENRFNDAADAVHNNPDTVDNAKALKDAEDKFNNLQKEHDAIKAELEKLKEQNNKPKEETTPAKGKFEERKEVRKELIEKIDKRLKDKFQSVRDKLKAQRSQFNANPIPVEIVPDLVNIAKDLVAKGVIKAADIVDTIYHELKEDLGDATARDVRDAISKYGQTTKPSEHPDDKNFAEAKATMRLLSAIEDANEGKPPLKSGFQRPEPSQDLRDLRKQLNDAIKKNQINAIDGERHMKSLLDAAKKRMQNSIDDLTRAIDNNEKLPKRESGIKYDEEANKLREKRKELRSQYDKMFGTDKELTPEEKEQRRANQLQAQLEDLQNGVVKNKSTDKITSDRIEELKAQIAKIKGDNTLKSLQAQFADKQDNKFTPEQSKDIWNYMKENYLNKGLKYVDAIKMVGNDLGLTFNQVSHAIVTPKLKPIADAVWKNRGDLAKHRAATQRYIDEQTQNPLFKNFKRITNSIREAAVFGHGGVFVGTHAGMTLFDNPTRSIHTIKAFFNAYKLAYGKTATYERMMTELKNENNYVMAQRAGLKNNPDQINSDSEIHKPMFGRLSESGARGFNSIKILRQALFDAHWNDLSAADKAVVGKDGIPLAAKEIAREINLATGATTVKLPDAVNEITFAGGMEVARWQKLLENPAKAANSAYKILLNPSKATVADKVFLKVWSSRVGWQLGLYAAALGVNAAIQSQLNPNNKVNFTDWKKADWLKYKFGDKAIADVSSGMLSPVHFIGKLAQVANSTSKERHGDTEAQAYGNEVFHYVRGKLAPGYSLMTDLATKHDYMGNTLPFYSEKPDNKFSHKLTYPEYLWSKAPLPVAEAAKITYESAHDNGVSNKMYENIWKGAGYGLLSGTTGFKAYENNNHTK